MAFKHFYLNGHGIRTGFINRIAQDLCITVTLILHFCYQVLLILIVFILLKLFGTEDVIKLHLPRLAQIFAQLFLREVLIALKSYIAYLNLFVLIYLYV